MTWTSTKSTGSGRLRYRLEIEGWPDEWVTDRSITHATGAATRNVRVGLDMSGVRIHDRSVMYEGSCESDGITFKIRPEFWRQSGATSWDDPATQSFSRRVDTDDGALAFATTAITSTDMTMPTCLPATLSNSTYYHMNTEVVYVTTWPNISARAQWGTTAQAHVIGAEDTDVAGYWVYDAPPTMEGRRAFLHVYGDADVGAGNGTCVWRGFVRRPPDLDKKDGVTWSIRCDGVTAVLKQMLAGQTAVAKPVGIYHHADCGVHVYVSYRTAAKVRSNSAAAPGDESEASTTLVGWHVDEASLFQDINAQIAAYLITTSADDCVESVTVGRDSAGTLGVTLKTTSATCGEFRMTVGSPILGGFFQTGSLARGWTPARWTQIGGNTTRSGFGKSRFKSSTSYWGSFSAPGWWDGYEEMPWAGEQPLQSCSPLGPAAAAMSVGNLSGFGKAWTNFYVSTDATERTNNPGYRIYTDRNMSGVTSVFIADSLIHKDVVLTNKFFEVTATGDDAGRGYYIDLAAPNLPPEKNPPYVGPGASAANVGFLGMLGPESEILTQRVYGEDTTVFDFMEELAEVLSIAHANEGDVPFITTGTFGDVTEWDQIGVAVKFAGAQQGFLAFRKYSFYRPISLRDFLLEELKLVGYFMRISALGKIDVTSLPTMTGTTPVPTTHRLTRADIVTPADDYGDWPSWEPQRDGRISVVTIQFNYDPIEDKWVDPPFVARDLVSIAATKTRGKVEASIRPYSVPSQPATFAASREVLTQVALRFLDLFAKDYDVVRIAVPFTKFDIICGEIVTLTHDLIPSGLGTRGVTSRRGVVIERMWDMDPSGSGHGYLTIMLAPARLVGYAPSGRITSQTNTAGNNWSLTLSVANAYNIAWSTLADGKVLEHFAAGDYIRIVQWDDANSTSVTGTISGTPSPSAGTCLVALDGVWTPGSDTWILEFQKDTGGAAATAAQRAYAYVASSSLALNDGTLARKFS